MNSCEHVIDIIIQSTKDIDKLKDIKSYSELLYINTILTSVQLKHICNILKPKHIIFRQNSNNIIKALSESIVFSIPIDTSIDNTIFSSRVNRITFYWNRNRPLTKNIYPSWIYEMYNNIFHNIDSLNKLCITKSSKKYNKSLKRNM